MNADTSTDNAATQTDEVRTNTRHKRKSPRRQRFPQIQLSDALVIAALTAIAYVLAAQYNRGTLKAYGVSLTLSGFSSVSLLDSWIIVMAYAAGATYALVFKWANTWARSVILLFSACGFVTLCSVPIIVLANIQVTFKALVLLTMGTGFALGFILTYHLQVLIAHMGRLVTRHEMTRLVTSIILCFLMLVVSVILSQYTGTWRAQNQQVHTLVSCPPHPTATTQPALNQYLLVTVNGNMGLCVAVDSSLKILPSARILDLSAEGVTMEMLGKDRKPIFP